MRLSRPIVLINFLIWMAALANAQIHVLIIDGVNNHDWAAGTAGIRSILDEAGGFSVNVSTVTPEKFGQWNPDFTKYQVVVNNFNGGHTDKGIEWPERVEKALETYVNAGGGLVVYHAANNAFLHWAAYNEEADTVSLLLKAGANANATITKSPTRPTRRIPTSW